MKFATVLLAATVAANAATAKRANAGACPPCGGSTCEIKGDPHIVPWGAKKSYKLDPKKNNLLYSLEGKNKVTARVSPSGTGEYVTSVTLGGKTYYAKDCEKMGLFKTVSIPNAKVSIFCAKPKAPMCKIVDCSLYHFDIDIERDDTSIPFTKKDQKALCNVGCECGGSPSGETCDDIIADCLSDKPKGCNKWGGNDGNEKCASYDKCLKPHEKELKKNNCPAPSPTPTPSGETCDDIIADCLYDKPKGCSKWGGNDGIEKCASYDKCLKPHQKELKKNNCPVPSPTPSPGPGPSPSGDKCTCTARCTAFGDPHVKSFDNTRTKTTIGHNKKMDLYTVKGGSVQAWIDGGKTGDKEFMTKLYFNNKMILDASKCKDGEGARFQSKDGSVKGKGTCRNNSPDGTMHINIQLQKHFEISAQSSIMKQHGAGNQVFADIKSYIGGKGFCMEGNGRHENSNVNCRC